MAKDNNNIRWLRNVIYAWVCSRTPWNVKYAIEENYKTVNQENNMNCEILSCQGKRKKSCC